MSHHKSRLSSLASDYTKIPNALFAMGLSPNAVALYCYLASGADTFDPPSTLIAERLGLYRKTVDRAFRELDKAGVLFVQTVRRSGTCTRRVWEFVDPAAWTGNARPLKPLADEARPSDDLAPGLQMTRRQGFKSPHTIKKDKEEPSKRAGSALSQERGTPGGTSGEALRQIEMILVLGETSGASEGQLSMLQRFRSKALNPKHGLSPRNLEIISDIYSRLSRQQVLDAEEMIRSEVYHRLCEFLADWRYQTPSLDLEAIRASFEARYGSIDEVLAGAPVSCTTWDEAVGLILRHQGSRYSEELRSNTQRNRLTAEDGVPIDIQHRRCLPRYVSLQNPAAPGEFDDLGPGQVADLSDLMEDAA